ncbi:hypothetical protein [Nocardia lasii]|uniref:ESX-1 secretion-associated protein n=1 Tax=Nocardia lasii TaxID=1616107 RepID=A0ABW1JUS6_9NOCA
MDSDAARRIAQGYQRFADQCDGWIDDAKELQRLSGFGGLTSAQQLQQGFERKAFGLVEVLQSMKAAALRMAAGYLQAGELFEEVDAMNARALKAAVQEVDS